MKMNRSSLSLFPLLLFVFVSCVLCAPSAPVAAPAPAPAAPGTAATSFEALLPPRVAQQIDDLFQLKVPAAVADANLRTAAVKKSANTSQVKNRMKPTDYSKPRSMFDVFAHVKSHNPNIASIGRHVTRSSARRSMHVSNLQTTGADYTIHHNFNPNQNDGANVKNNKLTFIPGDESACAYGLTQNGGTYNSGTIYEICFGAGTYATLFEFDGQLDDGHGATMPRGGFVLAPNNIDLYATALSGGLNDEGVLLKLNRQTQQVSVVASLYGNPQCTPAYNDGFLYIITQTNGDPQYNNNRYGSVVKYSIAANTYETIYYFNSQFNGGVNNAHGFEASLTVGPDGRLYGCSTDGGANAQGAIFSLNTVNNNDNCDFRLLHSFATGEGLAPYSTPSFGPSGSTTFYGTTFSDYSTQPDRGTIWKFDTATNSFATIYHFQSDDPQNLRTALTYYNGYLYGVAAGPSGTDISSIYRFKADGTDPNLHIVYAFAADGSDGRFGLTDLVLGYSGRMYSALNYGGTGGGGVIYSINPDVTVSQVQTPVDCQYTRQETACSVTCGRGFNYVTYTITQQPLNGGAACPVDEGLQLCYPGTAVCEDHLVFSYNVIATFNNDIGSHPHSAVTQQPGVDRLWGVAALSGNNGGRGSIFVTDQNGAFFAVGYIFTDESQGAVPYGAPFFPAAPYNNFFVGTTRQGGAFGKGVLYKFITEYASYQLLFSFGADGGAYDPYAGVVSGNQPNLVYGTLTAGGPNSGGAVYSFDLATNAYTVIHNFAGLGLQDAQGQGYVDGSFPSGGLAFNSNDGKLYGTTMSGGNWGRGVLFRMNVDGSNYQVLHHFGDSNLDGRFPTSAPVVDESGTLYGFTSFSDGTMWSYSDAAGYQLLKIFYRDGFEIGSPIGSPTLGPEGTLFGTGMYGGKNDQGAAFKINRDGSNYQNMHSFLSGVSGYHPVGSVTVYSGSLYVFASDGGQSWGGDLVRINPSGQVAVDCQYYLNFDVCSATCGGGSQLAHYEITQYPNEVGAQCPNDYYQDCNTDACNSNADTNLHVLHNFGDTSIEGDGFMPLSEPVLSSIDNCLYGGAVYGGSQKGVIYKYCLDSSAYQIIFTFPTDESQGANPYGSFHFDDSGLLWGSTFMGGSAGNGVIFKLDVSNPVDTFQLVHQFQGIDSVTGDALGGGLFAAPVFNPNDNMYYGTTVYNGFDGSAPTGGGVAYRLNPATSEYTVLHVFGLPNGATGGEDGTMPVSRLVLKDGFLYGVAVQGGDLGVGVIFKLSPLDGNVTIVHHFGSALDAYGNAIDGNWPYGSISLTASGNIYGSTFYDSAFSGGVIWKLSASDEYSVIHSIGNVDNGGSPLYAVFGTLAVDEAKGLVWGVAMNGGDAGRGGIFQAKLDGSSLTVLHSFVDLESTQTQSGLTLLPNGNLVGVSFQGGSYGQGTLWEYVFPTVGPFTIIHNFQSLDGDQPLYSRSIIDSANCMLGTTSQGGSTGMGVLYRQCLSGDMQFTVLHDFMYDFTPESQDAGSPMGITLRTIDGEEWIYGVAMMGGISQYGTIWKLKISDPQNTFAIIHQFTGVGSEGAAPIAALTIDAGGVWAYGSTVYTYTTPTFGGAGVIYRFNLDTYEYQVVRAMGKADHDPAYILAPLTILNGVIYGVSSAQGNFSDGTMNELSSSATVFKITPEGQLTVLHNLDDGSSTVRISLAPLVPDLQGTLYGTGAYVDFSTSQFGGFVFAITADGTYRDVALFGSNPGEPSATYSGVAIDEAHSYLYWGTIVGGANNQGALVRVHFDGSGLEVVHDYGSSAIDASTQIGTPVFNPVDGNIYGTTTGGGSNGYGTLWRFNPSLYDGVVVPNVDCVYTSTVSELCEGTCGLGTQAVYFFITTPASGNGAACPVNTTQSCSLEPCPAQWQFTGPVYCAAATPACGAGGVFSRDVHCVLNTGSVDTTGVSCAGLDKPIYSTAVCTSYASDCIPTFTQLDAAQFPFPSLARFGVCQLHYPSSTLYRLIVSGGVPAADALSLNSNTYTPLVPTHGVYSYELDSTSTSLNIITTPLGYGPLIPAYDHSVLCGSDQEFGQNLGSFGGLSQPEDVVVDQPRSGAVSAGLRQTCRVKNNCLRQSEVENKASAWDRYLEPATVPARANHLMVSVSDSYAFMIGGRSVTGDKKTLLNDVFSVDFLDENHNPYPTHQANYIWNMQAPFTPRYASAGAFFNYKPRYHLNPVYRGFVAVIGGLTSSNSASNEVWIMHLSVQGRGTWEETPTYTPFEARGRSAFVKDDATMSLYLSGGIDTATNTLYNDVWRISILQANLASAPSAGLPVLQYTLISQARSIVPSGRFSHGLAILDNILFSFGGQGPDGVLADVWAADLPAVESQLAYVTYAPYLQHELKPKQCDEGQTFNPANDQCEQQQAFPM